MVEAQRHFFKQVISIKLSQKLLRDAIRRFRDVENVTLIQGNSSKKLKAVISDLKSPSIFWLDGHYSGGVTARGDKVCPIFEELDAILNSTIANHIILIDDARLFVGRNGYPSLTEVIELIRNKKYDIHVRHDDVHCFPKELIQSDIETIYL